MSAAESGKEVIQSILVCHVDRRHVQVEFISVSAEDIVLADGSVEEVARRDARRILVVVLGSRRRNFDQ